MASWETKVENAMPEVVHCCSGIAAAILSKSTTAAAMLSKSGTASAKS